MTLTARRPMLARLGNRTKASSVPQAAVVYGFALPSLAVMIDEEDGRYYAVAQAVPMYGEGATMDDAVRDLLVSLANLRAELGSARDRLSPELAAQLRHLDSLEVLSSDSR